MDAYYKGTHKIGYHENGGKPRVMVEDSAGLEIVGYLGNRTFKLALNLDRNSRNATLYRNAQPDVFERMDADGLSYFGLIELTPIDGYVEDGVHYIELRIPRNAPAPRDRTVIPAPTLETLQTLAMEQAMTHVRAYIECMPYQALHALTSLNQGRVPVPAVEAQHST